MTQGKKVLKPNPKGQQTEYWVKPPKYPRGTIVCPICHLPETTGEYVEECHCWDESRKEGT